MKSLGDLVEARGHDAQNNFTFLRALAATLVIYGHSFALAPNPCGTCADLVRSLTHFAAAHVVGVMVFFTISGFLIASSYLRSACLSKFLLSRALRIYPGLVICLSVTVLLIGPLFTKLSLVDYFRSEVTAGYFMTNLGLYSTAYELPGVHFSATTHGTSVNGSLWTIPLEVRLYLCIALAGMTGILRSRKAANTMVILLGIIIMTDPARFPLTGENSATHSLIFCFVAGTCFFINRQFIWVDGRILVLMVVVAGIALPINKSAFTFISAAAVIYGVFCLAYAPKIPIPRWLGDYSYGIYLYGFPIQQMIAFLQPESGPYQLMAISIPAAWLAGALSWQLVEHPLMNLRKKL
jgi:Predicted acyltransferases